MKHILRYTLFVLCAFLIPFINLYAKDYNAEISDSDIKSWAKKMTDSGNYDSFCVYNYSDGDSYFKYAIAVPNDTSKNIEYYPISSKGDSDFLNASDAKKFPFVIEKENNITGNHCMKVSRNDFLEGCPKIDWDKNKGDNSVACSFWGVNGSDDNPYYFTVSTNNSVYSGADTSANIYSYTNSSIEVDLDKVITCKYEYENLIVRYDDNTKEISITHDGRLIFEWKEKNITKDNDEGEKLRNEYFKNNGKLKCPYLKCEYGALENIKLSKISSNSQQKSCVYLGGGSTINSTENNSGGSTSIVFPSINFGKRGEKCEDFLGSSGIKLINMGINMVRVAGIIITLVMGAITFIPPIVSKNKDELSKSLPKFVSILIILVILLLLKTLVKVFGLIVGFDLTCL